MCRGAAREQVEPDTSRQAAQVCCGGRKARCSGLPNCTHVACRPPSAHPTARLPAAAALPHLPPSAGRAAPALAPAAARPAAGCGRQLPARSAAHEAGPAQRRAAAGAASPPALPSRPNPQTPAAGSGWVAGRHEQQRLEASTHGRGPVRSRGGGLREQAVGSAHPAVEAALRRLRRQQLGHGARLAQRLQHVLTLRQGKAQRQEWSEARSRGRRRQLRLQSTITKPIGQRLPAARR